MISELEEIQNYEDKLENADAEEAARVYSSLENLETDEDILFEND
jgi:hypothetical protein